jgi:hypothetical protein
MAPTGFEKIRFAGQNECDSWLHYRMYANPI